MKKRQHNIKELANVKNDLYCKSCGILVENCGALAVEVLCSKCTARLLNPDVEFLNR